MEEKAKIFSYFQIYNYFPGIYIGENKYILKRNKDITLYDINSNRFKKIIYETNYYNLLNKSLDNKILFLSNKEEVALFNIELKQFISILKYEDFLTANIYENKEKKKRIISLTQKKIFVWDFDTYEIIYENDLNNFPTIEILNCIETKEYFIYLNNFEKKIFSINKNSFEIILFNINYFPHCITYYNEDIILFTTEENLIFYNIILKKEISHMKIFIKNENLDFKNEIYNINKTGKILIVHKNEILLYEKNNEELLFKKIIKLNGIYINYLYNTFFISKLNEDEKIIEKINL